jgi:transposase
MSGQRYTPEFKDEAVKQVLGRGYSVSEVSERLGVTPHSLYKWVNALKPENSALQATELLEAKREILKLKSDLNRTEVERDILKKAASALIALYQRLPRFRLTSRETVEGDLFICRAIA